MKQNKYNLHMEWTLTKAIHVQ